MNMKRRDFLQSGFSLTSGLWLSQFLMGNQAYANTNETTAPRFFVEISISGGWHTNLAMDPWLAETRLDESDVFVEYRSDEVFRSGNIALGPAMKSLQNYASKMNIINGIFVSPTDGGHQAAEIYGTTGRGDGTSGTFAVEYELYRDPSPLGVVSSGNLYTGQSAVNTVNILNLANMTAEVSPDLPFQNPTSPIAKAMQVQKNNLEKFKEFQRILATQKLTDPNLGNGQIAAAAFKSGLAATASLPLNEANLDTHSNHPGAHLTGLTAMFDKLKNILTAFEKTEYANGQSLFDLTTFYITSEFSRTPALDGSKGTNHNPLNNSAIIISPDFKGNQVFGASRVVPKAESANGTSYLVAQMVDLATGDIMKSKADAQKRGTLIRPENVIATLAESLKVQRNIFPPIGTDVTTIRNLLK